MRFHSLGLLVLVGSIGWGNFLSAPAEGFIVPDVERCDNALDDDADGLIDLNDPDCDCEVVAPVSLIPNPSFEDMNCCPTDISQLECADVWIQASAATTDYVHTCGWMGWDQFPPPLPFPDGDGVMGFRDGRVREDGSSLPNWKEYAGACLTSPLQVDSSYRIEFEVGFVNEQRSPPINISFFGSPDCSNLPFGVGDVSHGCPTNGPGWIWLGSVFVDGGSGDRWVTAFIDVFPQQDIHAIAIGPDCPSSVNDLSLYYFFDKLILDNRLAFQLDIRGIGHPCSEDFQLGVFEGPDFTYQWYKEGIALPGETQAQILPQYGEGRYEVIIDDGENCYRSAAFDFEIPRFTNSVQETICSGSFYEFGNSNLSESGQYFDTTRTEDNCVNVISLELEVIDEIFTSVSARIFPGESFPLAGQNFKQAGEHEIRLTSSMGCDSVLRLQLDYYTLYFPTAFSPNLDGVNDRFHLYSEAGIVQESELQVFDRWGGSLYRGPSWDGKHHDQPLSPGVYLYTAAVLMDDGVWRHFSGAVNLLR